MPGTYRQINTATHEKSLKIHIDELKKPRYKRMMNMLRNKTPERKTPRLQVIHTSGSDDTPHLYGTMHITPREAQIGARKLISIHRGLKKRLYRVTVPAGVRPETVLRLAGAGKHLDRFESGDLFLKILIQK